jgi:MFS family permease
MTSPQTTGQQRAGWFHDPVLRLLVTGSLLNSVAFFATLPFLTLYLSDISAFSQSQIGAVVGSVALISAFGGFFGGLLTDRLGAVRLIRAGLALYVITYLLLALTERVLAVVLLVMLLGVGRLMVEPSMKKLLSLAAADTGSVMFRIRYVTLCLGAIIGPLIGAALYAVSRDAIFILPAVVFAGYFVFFSLNSARLRAVDSPRDEQGPVNWSVALRDRTLMLVIAAGLVVFFVFSQFESILPLFIKQERGDAAVGYFSTLLATNAALGIVMQYPVARISRRLSTPAMALIGCVGFAVSLVLFTFLTISPVFLYIGVVAWTVGEAVMVPLPDVLIHEYTPPERRGAYFGLAELRYLGFFLGPVAGGALLPLGTGLYFGSMAVVIFAAWPLLLGPARRITGGPAPPAPPRPAPPLPIVTPDPTGLDPVIDADPWIHAEKG